MRVGVHLWSLKYNAHTILQAQLKQIDELLRGMESFKGPAIFIREAARFYDLITISSTRVWAGIMKINKAAFINFMSK